MLSALLLLAVSDVQPATRAQFREQTRICRVSLKYGAHGPRGSLANTSS